MSVTIDRKFWDDGRHYRVEVFDDATMRLRLRCQRRWYVVACTRELRGLVKREVDAVHRELAAT